MHKDINELTEYLFSRPYSDNLTDDQEDELLDHTFATWNNYLLSRCKTPESVINYANLFWWYGGQDHPIPNPHKFLGYFYYRINFKSDTYDSTDILDSLSRAILTKAGYREANLIHDPQYMPENDPKIIAAAREYEAT